MKCTKAQREAAIIDLLAQAEYPHVLSEGINRDASEVLITNVLSFPLPAFILVAA